MELKIVQGDPEAFIVPFHASGILFYSFKCVNAKTASQYWKWNNTVSKEVLRYYHKWRSVLLNELKYCIIKLLSKSRIPFYMLVIKCHHEHYSCYHQQGSCFLTHLWHDVRVLLTETWISVPQRFMFKILSRS